MDLLVCLYKYSDVHVFFKWGNDTFVGHWQIREVKRDFLVCVQIKDGPFLLHKQGNDETLRVLTRDATRELSVCL